MRILLLALAIAVGQLATSLYLPSLPAMAHEFGVGPAAATWTLTAFYIGFALCNLVAGPLADAKGRLPVLFGGLAIYVAGSVLCATASSITLFILGRLIQAAGTSAPPVVARAMLRDGQSEGTGTQAMIWISIAMAASPALGPPLGGLIQQTLGWRWAFLSLAAAGTLILAAATLLLEETLRPTARTRATGLVRRYLALLTDAIYCRHVGALSCLFAGLGVFFATGPFLFIQMLGLSPIAYGLLNVVNVAGYLGGSALASRLARHLPAPALVRIGTLIALVGGIAMAALAAAGIFATWSILGPVAILTLGFGIVLPAGTAAALDRHPAQAGLASAMLGFIQVAAAAAGTAIAGIMLGHGVLPVACVFFALTAAAAWLAHGLHPTTGPVPA